jgi:hypothetical protein
MPSKIENFKPPPLALCGSFPPLKVSKTRPTFLPSEGLQLACGGFAKHTKVILLVVDRKV